MGRARGKHAAGESGTLERWKMSRASLRPPRGQTGIRKSGSNLIFIRFVKIASPISALKAEKCLRICWRDTKFVSAK